MASIADYVLDAALSKLDTEADLIHITSAEATSWADVATYTLGDAAVSIGAPADRSGGGREVTVAAVSGAAVDNSGTATHYAIVDSSNTRLLVTGSLTASQAVVSGNTFSLGAFTIGIPDPA
jgi:hypothetical protein